MRGWARCHGWTLLVFVLTALLFIGAQVVNWRTAEATCHATNGSIAIANTRAATIRQAIRLG